MQRLTEDLEREKADKTSVTDALSDSRSCLEALAAQVRAAEEQERDRGVVETQRGEEKEKRRLEEKRQEALRDVQEQARREEEREREEGETRLKRRGRKWI